MKGFIATDKECGIDEVWYVTCPGCETVQEEDAIAFDDYHTVYEIGHSPPYKGQLTGYTWCLEGDCNWV